ncbi:hypothetical protein C6361_23975 [Plantactinospora sp. BC1]|uniref:formyltransferase family protein n=1 Tax=Plantactinospora sp. BC1 TaxID=2108470 RepID=UPI000D165837|nr:formyltransferase family protein [Plantactinospora sp. BC1]AVT32024.1 hypothetical protein C6361_23975 [Plantactinospora sp. BC1]
MVSAEPPMRVAIGGRGWLPVRAARLLGSLVAAGALEARIEVVRNDGDPGRDTWMPSLAALAQRRGWRVHRTAETAGLGPRDVFLSLQHDVIVDCARLGGAAAYNLHFALLPHYRGSLTSLLPIRRGESRVGVTLHVLAPSVDAGPVIATRAFELPPFTTAYDLFQTYHRYGFELLKEHLEALLHGTVTATAQDDSAATTFYRSSVDFTDLEVSDFDRDAEQVRDWCRSLIFPPIQLPTYRGRRVGSCYVLRWNGVAAAPGTVLDEDPDQVVVACRRDLVCLEFATD